MTANLENDSRFMDQYSRQIGAYGLETMGKLVQMDVLIVGLRGVGIECAKNLCLAGPKSVTVCDPAPVVARDLGSNFFLTEEDLGKPRAGCVVGAARANARPSAMWIHPSRKSSSRRHDRRLYRHGRRCPDEMECILP